MLVPARAISGPGRARQETTSSHLKLLDTFTLLLGLKVNYGKTEALWIGKSRLSNQTLLPQRKLTWARRKVKALGVRFSTDEGNSPLLNFEDKIENLNKIVDNWPFRRLTPLPTHQKSLEEVNRIIFNFLWDGRGDRIKRSAMINDYDKGGLKMIDIKTFNSSLKVIWVKKYLDSANTGNWILFFDFYHTKHGGKRLFSGNLNTDDIKYLNIKDEFLQEILHIWAEINFQNTLGDFQNTSLWHNSLIRVGKTPVYFPSWSIRSINQVKDLMDGKSRFLTYAAFKSKYSLSSNYLDYYGFITAVQSIEDKVSSEGAATQPNPLDQLLKLNDFSKAVYKLLIQRKTTKPLKSERKWETLCGEEENIVIDWEKAYSMPTA